MLRAAMVGALFILLYLAISGYSSFRERGRVAADARRKLCEALSAMARLLDVTSRSHISATLSPHHYHTRLWTTLAHASIMSVDMEG